jgi:putative solute:sodium symporter small subunit
VDTPEATSVPGSDAEAREGGQDPRGYWRANLRLMGWLLAVWFVASFGLGILLVEPLNAFFLGGFPLGFWFAHQGSILVFVVLVGIYAVAMDRLDRHYGVD